jgi:hypothetical protein
MIDGSMTIVNDKTKREDNRRERNSIIDSEVSLEAVSDFFSIPLHLRFVAAIIRA